MRKKFLPFLFLLTLLSACMSAVVLPSAARAGARYVPGDVLVVFRGEEGTRVRAASLRMGREAFRVASLATTVGARVETTYPALSEAGNGVFAHLHSDVISTEELVENLLARDDVLAASPNRIARAMVTPNDPAYQAGSQWGLEAIRMPEAWSVTTGSPDIYVAVMDTGISNTNADLTPHLNTALSRNFDPTATSWADDNGHGSHVAGVIGAIGNNKIGVAGVNWNVGLISLKALDRNGVGTESNMVNALNYLVGLLQADANLKVAALNMSFAIYSSMPPTLELQTREVMWRALKALDSMNRTVLVTCAGNEGLEVGVPAPRDDTSEEPIYSRGDYVYIASFTGLNNKITVGAMQKNMTFANFSNWSSTRVELAAPGVSILSTAIPSNSTESAPFQLPDGTTVASWTGTSMATPHVAGAAALLMAAYPSSTAWQIKTALLQGADSSCFRAQTAYGLLDVKGALDYLAKESGSSVAPPKTDYDDGFNYNDGDQGQDQDQGDSGSPVSTSGGGGGCDAVSGGLTLALAAAAFLLRRRA